jgi:hypothetical protein
MIWSGNISSSVAFLILAVGCAEVARGWIDALQPKR